jgi:hypothetical protein
MAEKTERQHRATYARDRKKGGYLVRVEGPYANRFSARKVPVTRKDTTEHEEELDQLIWSGKDKETGKPVALYTFIPQGADTEEDVAF